jgi:hypothetical protein
MLPRALLIATILVLAAPVVPATAADDLHGPVDPSITDGSAQARLDAARARWAAHGYDDYRFTVQRLCFCGPSDIKPRRITVRDGRPRRPPRFVRDIATVKRLFAAIQRAITAKVHTLDARYGATGMPRHVFINPLQGLADEEETYEARRLRPL